MPRTALRRLTLTDFRSYERAALVLDGRPVFLFGPNGAGKTNLLEAISFLLPGRGLRNAAIAEVGRREPAEPQGRAWAVAATLEGADGPVHWRRSPQQDFCRCPARMTAAADRCQGWVCRQRARPLPQPPFRWPWAAAPTEYLEHERLPVPAQPP